MADGSVKIDIIADDSDAKKKLEGVEDAANETSDSLENLGDSGEKSGKGLGLLDIAAGNLVAGGISALISGIGNAISSIAALAEETREYREDMAKLDTAFKSAGHSVEAGQEAYEDFYAIIGESDRSVEAVNHLAELTNNTEELSKWSTIAAGVTAKFGDSLPIEGLTEAANETAKVGQTTGVLADALNWVSKDSAVFKQSLGGNQKALVAFNKAIKEGENVEDAFSAALSKMSTEQERSAAITNTLNGIYADAAAEYNAMTAETQKARRAAAEMEAAQARLGAAFEPVVTIVTETKAAFFNFAANLTENVAGAIEDTKNRTLGLTTEQRLLAEAAAESANKMAGLKLAADEAAIGISSQFNYTQSLADELFRLADANGKVQEADRARVEFILGKLKEATGEEYRLVDGTIQKYGELKNSIYDAIAAKRAEILLSAYEETYIEALNNRMAVKQAAADQQAALIEKELELERARQAELDAQAAFDKAREEGKAGVYIAAEGSRVNSTQQARERIERELAEQQKAYDELQGKVEETTLNINSYEEAKTAFMSGEYEKGERILNDWSNDYLSTAGDAEKANEQQIESAKNMVIYTSVQLGFLEAEYKDKQGSMTDAQKKEMQARIEAAKKEAQDAREEYYRVGGDSVEGLVQGVDDKDGQPQWNLAGKLGSIVQSAIDKMREKFDSHSPSRVTMSIGHDAIDGLIIGAEDKRKEAVNAFSSATKEVISGIEKEIEDGIKRIEKELERLDDIRTTANAKAIDAQKKALNKEKKVLQEREKAFSEFVKTHETQLSEMAKLEDEYSKNVLKVQETLTANIEKLWTDFENSRESRTQSIIGSLSLFEEAQKGEAVSGKALTKNLKSQIGVLDDYNAAILALTQRDANPAFIEAMTSLGVDALPELEALVKMTDEELSAYVELWEEKNRLAASASAKSLEMAREETEKEVEKLTDEATKEVETLTLDYRKAMLELLGEISTGMLNAGEAGVKALGETVGEYIKSGHSLMEGVAEGIKDGKSEVVNAAVDAVLEAIEAAQIEAGIKAELTDTVYAENARYGYSPGVADNGVGELTRAVGIQSAGINSLVKQGQSRSGNNRPIVLTLNGRELGRAVVDVGTAETVRAGIKVTGGA